MDWRVPRDWDDNRPLTAEDMRSEVTEKLEYLLTRPRGIAALQGDASRPDFLSINSTSYTDMDSEFEVTINVDSVDQQWMILLNFNALQCSSTNWLAFDIYDEATSLRLGDALPFGLALFYNSIGEDNYQPFSVIIPWKFDTLGEHTLRLQWATQTVGQLGYLRFKDAYNLFGAIEGWN